MIPANPAARPTEPEGGSDDLLAQLAAYRLMVENIADVIIRGEVDGKRTYVSPGVREMLGYEPEQMLGSGQFELLHPGDRDAARAVFANLSPEHPLASLTFRLRRRDGTYIWIAGRYRHIAEDGSVLAVLRDITAAKHAEDQLAEANRQLAAANLALQTLADRDGLTGLANRRYFDARLAEEFRRAGRHALPVGLVLLDVDAFKPFNDRYGHLAGDDCLRRVSGTVEGVLRRPGDLAARYGGEEIVALLPATDEAGAVAIAERMRADVAALGIAHDASAHGVVTLSAGASAMIPDTDEDAGKPGPDALIEAADRALYAAKTAGRNTVRAAPPRLPRAAGADFTHIRVGTV